MARRAVDPTVSLPELHGKRTIDIQTGPTARTEPGVVVLMGDPVGIPPVLTGQSPVTDWFGCVNVVGPAGLPTDWGACHDDPPSGPASTTSSAATTELALSPRKVAASMYNFFNWSSDGEYFEDPIDSQDRANSV